MTNAKRCAKLQVVEMEQWDTFLRKVFLVENIFKKNYGQYYSHTKIFYFHTITKSIFGGKWFQKKLWAILFPYQGSLFPYHYFYTNGVEITNLGLEILFPKIICFMLIGCDPKQNFMSVITY